MKVARSSRLWEQVPAASFRLERGLSLRETVPESRKSSRRVPQRRSTPAIHTTLRSPGASLFSCFSGVGFWTSGFLTQIWGRGAVLVGPAAAGWVAADLV